MNNKESQSLSYSQVKRFISQIKKILKQYTNNHLLYSTTRTLLKSLFKNLGWTICPIKDFGSGKILIVSKISINSNSEFPSAAKIINEKIFCIFYKDGTASLKKQNVFISSDIEVNHLNYSQVLDLILKNI